MAECECACGKTIHYAYGWWHENGQWNCLDGSDEFAAVPAATQRRAFTSDLLHRHDDA